MSAYDEAVETAWRTIAEHHFHKDCRGDLPRCNCGFKSPGMGVCHTGQMVLDAMLASGAVVLRDQLERVGWLKVHRFVVFDPDPPKSLRLSDGPCYEGDAPVYRLKDRDQ